MRLTQEEKIQRKTKEVFADEWDGIDTVAVNLAVLTGVLSDRSALDWTTPPESRCRIEQKFLRQPGVTAYNVLIPSQSRAFARKFREFAGPEVFEMVRAHVFNVPKYMGRKPRVKHLPKAQGKRPARLPKREAENLELISFVVERIIPFGQLLDKRLDKHDRDVRLLPGHRGPKVAVPRQALKKEWNRTHHRVKSGDVLMTKFHRAARKPHLCREFLQQVGSEIGEAWAQQEAALAELRGCFARLSDAERAKLAAPIDAEAVIRKWEASPEGKASREKLETLRKKSQDLRRRQRARFSSDEEYQEWKAKRDAEREEEWRASLTRRDLIQKRVRWLVWQLPDEAPGEEWQLWQSPLRDWFLPEARGEPTRFHFWSRT